MSAREEKFRGQLHGLRGLSIICEEGAEEAYGDDLGIAELINCTPSKIQELEQGEGVCTVEILVTAIIALRLILQLLKALQVIFCRKFRHIVEALITVVNDGSEFTIVTPTMVTMGSRCGTAGPNIVLQDSGTDDDHGAPSSDFICVWAAKGCPTVVTGKSAPSGVRVCGGASYPG